jgi:hypothetical protein
MSTIDGLRQTEAAPVLADIAGLVLCAASVVSWCLIGWLALP